MDFLSCVISLIVLPTQINTSSTGTKIIHVDEVTVATLLILQRYKRAVTFNVLNFPLAIKKNVVLEINDHHAQVLHTVS